MKVSTNNEERNKKVRRGRKEGGKEIKRKEAVSRLLWEEKEKRKK